MVSGQRAGVRVHCLRLKLESCSTFTKDLGRAREHPLPASTQDLFYIVLFQERGIILTDQEPADGSQLLNLAQNEVRDSNGGI
jgi:hypothetical protein